MQLTKINGEFELWLPEHRAVREQWNIANGGWEVERIRQMVDTIDFIYASQKAGTKWKKPIVFDVGTEEGDISALIAKYTECEMVMFEPNHRVLSCIKSIFTGNGLDLPPLFLGFLANDNFGLLDGLHLDWKHVGDVLNPEHGFKALHENYPDVPRITLDEYCKRTGVYPDVITMDVEGSEFEVIRGAEKVLREKKPTIFMSVHPEFMFESYRNTGEWLEKYGERQHVVHMLRFIDELGYTHRCIEYDYHELHLVFEPK